MGFELKKIVNSKLINLLYRFHKVALDITPPNPPLFRGGVGGGSSTYERKMVLLIICYSQLRETETRLTGFDPATFAVTERRSPN